MNSLRAMESLSSVANRGMVACGSFWRNVHSIPSTAARPPLFSWALMAVSALNASTTLAPIKGWREVRQKFEPHGTYDPKKSTRQQQECKIDIDQIPTIGSFGSAGVDFAVEGLIALRAVNMLSGESGHGKSTIALGMANPIAKGREFAGRRCSKGWC